MNQDVMVLEECSMKSTTKSHEKTEFEKVNKRPKFLNIKRFIWVTRNFIGVTHGLR